MDEAEGARTAAMAREAGGDALFERTDVSRSADCARIVEAAVRAYGGLDVAFNNAGIGSSGFPLHEEEEETFDRMIAINLKGVFLSMRHEIAAMLKGGASERFARVAAAQQSK